MTATTTTDPVPAKFTDAMIDVEGCSDHPDAAPHEIGLAFFDLEGPDRPPFSSTIPVNAMSAIRLGFSITGPTLVWWEQHLKKPIDLNMGLDFPEALRRIASLFQSLARPDVRVWSRGNSYDLSILRLGYYRTASPLPWQYWLDRDVRTWLQGFGDFKSKRKNNHIAEEDALNQIADIHEALHGRHYPLA